MSIATPVAVPATTPSVRSSSPTSCSAPRGFHDVGTGPGSPEAKYLDRLTISDNAVSVAGDVARIRNHPLVPATIPIYGYLYDVRTGRLVEVPEATTAGAVRTGPLR